MFGRNETTHLLTRLLMKKLYLLLICALPCVIVAQECTCESNFLWVKKTFEENDAGFEYALEQKGKEAYKAHTDLYLEKVQRIEEAGSVECTETLYEFLTFFRSGHIGIVRSSGSSDEEQENPLKDEEIIKQFEDWESVEVDLKAFEEELSNQKEAGFEGIWQSGVYKVGIKEMEDAYVGFIIEADGVYWRPGQVKFKIAKNEGDFPATFYMRDHSVRDIGEVDILGNNYLQMGFISFDRLKPKFDTDSTILQYVQLINASEPFAEKLSDQTVLLRIPSFNYNQKGLIDSVINEHRELMMKTENLIIDLRNNGGGSDNSFSEILPFIYTNPIRTVGVELLSTPLNNQRMRDFLKERDLSEEDKEWINTTLDTLENHIGEFVSLNKYPVSVSELDTVYEYPKNVGIIIHENNGSTTEQFLLAAKQSKKVKLFGTTTAGVLDISNMYSASSPCNQFQLAYSLSKSMRIPDMTIDDKGIQPDYYIDDSIPDHEWISFVESILSDKAQ